MSQSTLATGFNQESFDAFIALRDEPSWLTDLRNSAWKHYCNSPMPSQLDEEWMRTDIRLLHLDRFSLPAETDDATLPTAVLSEGVTLSGMLAMKDSRVVATELDARAAAQGVLFGNLETMVREHGDLLRPYLLLTKAVDPLHFDKFSALHAAFFTGWYRFFTFQEVSVVKQPLCMRCLYSAPSGQVDLGHTLVIIEEGAEVNAC